MLYAAHKRGSVEEGGASFGVGWFSCVSSEGSEPRKPMMIDWRLVEIGMDSELGNPRCQQAIYAVNMGGYVQLLVLPFRNACFAF